jgi:hypothetical protein
MFLMIGAGISLAATAAGMYETSQAEQAQLESIRIKEKQRNLQISQKKLSMYDETKKVLSRQIAQATVRGVGLDSPSLNAIQRETFNISSKGFQNIETTSELMDFSTEQEKENVRMTTHAKLFGEAANLGTSLAQLKGAK